LSNDEIEVLCSGNNNEKSISLVYEILENIKELGNQLER
jgi:hypothetical protein